MIKIVKPKNFNDFIKHIDYGRLVVHKLDDKYVLCLAFYKVYETYSGSRKTKVAFLYELKSFSSLDDVLRYIKTGEIDEIYDINLNSLTLLNSLSLSQEWYISNFKLNKDKLKFMEVKAKLIGWKPYDYMWP